MKVYHSNSSTRTLLLLVIGLSLFAGLLILKNSTQQTDELRTWSAIVNFGRSRDQALRFDPPGAAAMLNVITTLPLQTTNGPLGWIVLRERKRISGEIMDYLRAKTGENLGNDPAKWIIKYDPGQSKH